MNMPNLHRTGLLLFVISILTIYACTPAADNKSHKKINNNIMIGWLHGNCLAIKADIDLSSYRLTVVNLDENQDVSTLLIGNRTENSAECYALLDDRSAINLADERRFYTVISSTPINLAIGVVTTGGETKPESVLDSDGDGINDTFSYCSGSEGMNFSVWSGEAHKSQLIWSDYYYLGYDIEADCPDMQ